MTAGDERPRAAIVAGGWRGHRPHAAAALLERALESLGFDVDVERSLRFFDDHQHLAAVDVVVPLWTMGRLAPRRAAALGDAVAAGTGLAGFHGTADAFRGATDYQYLLGGQFVAHPGGDGVDYRVAISGEMHPVTMGLPTAIQVKSEQYYMHVDPSNSVLATTKVPRSDGRGHFEMPVAWVRSVGRGRVFYCSLGHTPDVLAEPPVLQLITRGIAWAARKECLLSVPATHR
jgi:type 1 glutamine amidotransferase